MYEEAVLHEIQAATLSHGLFSQCKLFHETPRTFLHTQDISLPFDCGKVPVLGPEVIRSDGPVSTRAVLNITDSLHHLVYNIH